MNSCVSVDRCAFARPFEGRFVGVEHYQKANGAATPSPPALSPILKPINEMRAGEAYPVHPARHYYNEWAKNGSRAAGERRRSPLTERETALRRLEKQKNQGVFDCGRHASKHRAEAIAKTVATCIETRKHRARQLPCNARVTPFAGI